MSPVRRGGLVAAAVAAWLILPAADADAAKPLRAATTSGDSEIRDTIPITKREGAEPRVAISLGSPKLNQGDDLKALGEVQITNTCVEPDPRCIGKRYSFSPRASARLILAKSRNATTGRRLGKGDSVTCGQRRPNRNHHCVLVLPKGELDVPAPDRLPCRGPARCFVNLVLEAHHPNAKSGNRLIIGADRPNGSVEQGKGRVSALVIGNGTDPGTQSFETKRRISKSVPMSPNRGGGWRSIYSVKLPNLQRGDVITARARQIFDIGGIPNAAFDSNRIVLTQGPRKTGSGPIARNAAQPGPALTEANGFNCTHGPSAYRTPCVSRKAGQVEIKRDPVDNSGDPAPLYVNLIGRGLIKEAQRKRGTGSATIRRGGYLRVKRWSAP